MPSELQLEHARPESVLAGLSRDIVGIYARLLGRGPTKARTYLHDDHGLCVLEDVFTKGERTLIAAGLPDRVLETRHGLHRAIDSELIRVVEERTGRQVRVCVGQVDVSANLAVEYFQFELAGAGDDRH
jgi:uncharacterized protein YbcI